MLPIVYTLELPIYKGHLKSFRAFLKEIGTPVSCSCTVMYYGEKLHFVSNIPTAEGQRNKSSSLDPSGNEISDIRKFASKFNLSMLIPEGDRDISIEVARSVNYPRVSTVLKVSISIHTPEALKTVFDFFNMLDLND